jgi:hypothetical protein
MKPAPAEILTFLMVTVKPSGAPSFVGGTFSCAGNDKLKDLKGAPKEIEGSFYCSE